MIILVVTLLKLATQGRRLCAVTEVLLTPHSTSEPFLKNNEKGSAGGVKVDLLYLLIKENIFCPEDLTYFETLFTSLLQVFII